MKKLVMLLILLSTLCGFAQGEANIWYFGENAGLDFNSGNPSVLTDGNINTFEGCSSFSDKNGNLLFYSDGTTVWNKNHDIMLNGTGLLGHPSSTQSAMIIPKPDSTTEYYIFTVGARVSGGEFGFNYYTIDMSQESDLGEVVSGPVDLTEGRFANWTEKVAAIKGEECDTYWVISYVENEFYTYKVTSAGVSANPIKSAGFYTPTDRRGYLKISPNGKKVAIAHMADSRFLLYDFDSSTGQITNEKVLPLEFPTNKPYGAEFSANSEKLYVNASNDYNSNIFSEWNNPNNHFSTLYQFDISSNITSDIVDSRTVIDSQNLFRGGLQLGPDQKIYRALSQTYNIGIPFLGVIENPENDGLACNYKHEEIPLGGNNSTQGLPPFIASIFSQIEITTPDSVGNIIVLNDQTTNLCVGDNFNVIPEPLTGTTTYTWYFNGASTPYSSLQNLTFTNATSAINGTYSLVVEQVDICGNISILEGEFSLQVYNVPTANQPNNIIECDTDNGGFLTFDLKNLKDTEVLNGQSTTEFEVLYFKTQTDADTNTNAIINPYTNSAAFSTDTIIARIHNIKNPVCYDTKSFEIQVFEFPTPPTSITNLGKCDNSSIGTDTDGVIIFNLQEKELDILNGQTAGKFTIEYFTDTSYINKIPNTTTFENTTTIQPIYVKIFNTLNPNCVAFTNFNIEVFKLPTITTPVSLKQCDNDTDGYSAFNLNEVTTKISADAANETFTYFNSYVGADTNDINEIILTPTAYINKTPTTDTVWARDENANGCHRVSEINLVVSTTGIPASFQRIFYECDDYLDTTNDDRDGVTSFNFSNVTSEIEALFPVGQQLIIKYYRNETEALAETNPISDPSNYRNIGYLNTQIIYIRVDSQLDNDCLGFGAHITLNVEELPIANNVTIDRQCDDDFDGFFPFDVSAIELSILGSQNLIDVSITYFDSLGNQLQDINGNLITSSLPNPFLTTSQTITIRVTNNSTNDPDGACFDETTLEFIVDKKPVANTVADLIECDDDYDGFFDFDTSNIENSILNGQMGMVVSYFDENGNTLSPLPNPFNSQSQTITAKVENELNANCIAITTFDFIVNPKPQFDLDATAIYCLNLPPITVETTNSLDNYTYEWRNENNSIISTEFDAIISNAGNYTVIATSQEGCPSFPQTITIEPSIIATITDNDITVIDDSENNSIAIDTTNLGVGDYEFAIKKPDGFSSFYQDDPYFENLIPGIYTIFIRDKNNCGEAQIDVSIIGFPKFFTPNNDGINDTWTVLGVNDYFYPTSNIYIFDRFGKLITQIDPKNNGWNGIFNGQFLPATDYWFSVELVDKNGTTRIKKGHFSLIRR